MTTTTEKLLARADEYERKAAALRLAAEEIGEHDTGRAKERMNGHLTKAMALRDEQRGRPGKRHVNGAARRAAVRELLMAGEPVTSKTAAAHLGVGQSYAQRLLQEAGAVKVGQGHSSSWQLAAGAAQPASKAGKGAAPAIPRAPRGRKRLKPEETQAAISAVLQGASAPLTSTEIVRVLRPYGYKMGRAEIVKRLRQLSGVRREGGGVTSRYALS